MSIEGELYPVSRINVDINSKWKVKGSLPSSSGMSVDNGQHKWFGCWDEVVVLCLCDGSTILSKVGELIGVERWNESIFFGWVGEDSLSGGVFPDVLSANFKGMVHKVVGGHDELVLRVGTDRVDAGLNPLYCVGVILLNQETIVAIGWEGISNSDGISIEHVVVPQGEGAFKLIESVVVDSWVIG